MYTFITASLIASLSCSEEVPSSDTDATGYLTFETCRFDKILYPAPGFGHGELVLVAEDSAEPGCCFSLMFAERDPQVAAIMQIVETGDILDVYDIFGFFVATVDFTCSANSTGICHADQGKAEVVLFEPTIQDLEAGEMSGKAFQIDIDAQGTTPGNHGRLITTIHGFFP